MTQIKFQFHHCVAYNKIFVGDRPLAKVAEPEGSSEMVTFANHKESFFSPLIGESRDKNCPRLAKVQGTRQGTTITPGRRRFEEPVKVMHPKATSGTFGTQRSTWR